ncbi:MAG TPA: tRNA (N(6)-L-threonylcarbamoyladenosine(37)-C(2))-methylthiotransferase [Methanothrix sp.]|nr:tRNA (N(6)-L-threonylcarbamoyladenosine(37)-C(2))-methylthiotransferase [Methanothrix sp.]
MKFYIETYGCTANMGNSQDLARALQEDGHVPSSLDEADAVIVNTCAVTEKTERNVLRRLSLLQGERLIVAGCLPVAIPESISHISCRKRMGLLNQSSAAVISEIFNDSSVHSQEVRFQDALLHSPVPATGGGLCGIVNVAEGCNGSCSYCIVKKARGRLKSRRVEDVALDVENLVASGVAEVQVTAQDTAAYGSDIGTNLGQLLERLAAIPGDFMLRVGMMNPNSALLIKDQLLRAYQSPKIYRFLHIPVQSGSDRILRSMGRKYTAADFMEVVSAFRSAHPEITIITDVIVGFPGETEEDHEKTLDFVKRLQPDKVNITRFSARPGTAAARLYDMPDRFKKDRSRELTRLWQEIAEMRNIRLLGSTVAAQVTEMGKDDAVMARTENYREIVVHRSLDLGGVHRFKIVKTCPFYLEGEIVSRE